MELGELEIRFKWNQQPHLSRLGYFGLLTLKIYNEDS